MKTTKAGKYIKTISRTDLLKASLLPIFDLLSHFTVERQIFLNWQQASIEHLLYEQIMRMGLDK